MKLSGGRAVLLILAMLLTSAAQAAPRALMAAQSKIEFGVKQMGVTISGEFRQFDAQVEFDAARPAATRATVVVQIASLTTGDDETDETAVGQAWLDKLHFPQARFTSTAVKALGGERYEATGTLSIRGQSRTIVVPLSMHEQKDGTLLASGGLTIRRADFGIGGGEWNEGDIVAKEVPVTFHLLLGAPH